MNLTWRHQAGCTTQSISLTHSSRQSPSIVLHISRVIPVALTKIQMLDRTLANPPCSRGEDRTEGTGKGSGQCRNSSVLLCTDLRPRIRVHLFLQDAQAHFASPDLPLLCLLLVLKESRDVESVIVHVKALWLRPGVRRILLLIRPEFFVCLLYTSDAADE